MATNTLTNLIADLYVALDVVSRELVGFIPAVTIDATVARAAKDQTVRSHVVPAATAYDITPGITPPDNGENTIGNRTITISKSRYVPLKWNGEEQASLNNNGPQYLSIKQNQLAQGIRTLVNEVESDIAALHVYASRAYGAAATAPFASNLADTAQVLKILKDNGAPEGDLQLVLNTANGAALRTLAQVNKVNEAGSESMLRQGVLLDLHGFAIRESGQVKTVSAVGNNTGTYAANGAHTIGTTAIVVKTGSGTILAGDVITFSNDTTIKYVVETGVDNGVGIVLRAPGLRKALAGNETIAVVAATARSMAFSRSAIVLATRLPALPKEGDSAVDRITITDPRSGISFELALYQLYRQMKYELSLAWGQASMKDEHVALLIS